MSQSFGVGIPCHNESQNIIRLLEELERQFHKEFWPDIMVIVSSGSSRATDSAIRNFINHSALPLVLITESERKGKGHAVNQIIEHLKSVDIILLLSGDILPRTGALDRLYRAFEDPRVGLAGGRPVPEGPAGNVTHRINKLLWDLHHIIALSRPKSTEITAFRNIHRYIDESTLVDEAALEQIVSSLGYTIKYVPDALIRNLSPLTLRDYFRHRVRVTRGHIELARKTRYFMGTLSLRERSRAVKRMIREGRFPLLIGMSAAVIEGMIAVTALILCHMKPRKSGRWSMIGSAKRPFKTVHVDYEGYSDGK